MGWPPSIKRACWVLLIACPLAFACGDKGFGGDWVGSCEIPAGPALGGNVDLNIELVSLKHAPKSVVVGGTGDWSIWNGKARMTEPGREDSQADALVHRCDSADGCTNQGDPYGNVEALFNIKTSETQMAEVVMKGTPLPEDASTYTGICQTRREGQLISGSFSLSRM